MKEKTQKLYNMNCLDYLQSEQFVKDVEGGATYYCYRPSIQHWVSL